MRRLVLFDIDGTLVVGGPAKEAFHVAMIDAFGTAGRIEGHDFSGKTDPQIARELLTGAGLTDDEVDAGFPELWRRYLEELESRLPDRPVDVLTGVAALLDELEQGGVPMGLLTGNIADGARLKLASGGLADRFDVGGYGSDHEIRNNLPPIAIERAREHFGVDFAPEEVVVVGDTPRDVECGRRYRCRTLAVATGRFGVDDLRGTGADEVLEDLRETERVVELLVTESGR